jgi:hypothetical protein
MTAEDDANVQAPLLVYLDHSDLVDIADGNAPDVDVFKHALAESGANLLISSIHLVDLGESTPSTKQRWIDAVTQLAPLRFAEEPGSEIPLDRDGLTARVRDTASAIDAVRSVLVLKQQGDEAARAARLGGSKSRIPRKQIRKLAEAILDGNLSQFVDLDNAIVQQVIATVEPLRTMIENHAIDRAELLDGLFPEVADALTSGDLSELVRLRRQQDQKRNPDDSDTPDEWHLKFAVHADVFTVDGNVAQAMSSVSGRAMPIEGRQAGVGRERVYVYRSSQLDAVAKALLVLSGERR